MADTTTAPQEGLTIEEFCNVVRNQFQESERAYRASSGYGEPLSDLRPGRPTEEKEAPETLARGPYFNPEEMASTAALDLAFLGSKADPSDWPDVLINRGEDRAYAFLPPYEAPKIPDEPIPPTPVSTTTPDEIPEVPAEAAEAAQQAEALTDEAAAPPDAPDVGGVPATASDSDEATPAAPEPPSPTAVETPATPASVPQAPVSTDPVSEIAEAPAAAEIPEAGPPATEIPSANVPQVNLAMDFDIPSALDMETGILDLSFLSAAESSLPETPPVANASEPGDFPAEPEPPSPSSGEAPPVPTPTPPVPASTDPASEAVELSTGAEVPTTGIAGSQPSNVQAAIPGTPIEEPSSAQESVTEPVIPTVQIQLTSEFATKMTQAMMEVLKGEMP